ncbi:hypothetical protein D7Y13_22085 [Corallococcus praedator]|uniref:Uncharacterized protein n=1 Tax=Corallococcus praedator TaxID=2316724 RepID=A0ABX9QEA1_9BACT|nr:MULTISPECIES: hypothetical protein [Corallococcus]RKH04181.1 hypothetical protein D7X74_35545 [Corallococcus sp. CA047B]RKH21996.1 hypothetical protein D7X75_36290 [Corallococcus sp. CA031C]RKI05644.1 hypothetical protein D7Y13_22085 [Corallococcus praedator]
MKKLLALFGLVAGLAASSYSVPASAAATGANYDGPTTNAQDIIIIVIGDDEFYWVEYYGAAANASASAAPVLSDATFDR